MRQWACSRLDVKYAHRPAVPPAVVALPAQRHADIYLFGALQPTISADALASRRQTYIIIRRALRVELDFDDEVEMRCCARCWRVGDATTRSASAYRRSDAVMSPATIILNEETVNLFLVLQYQEVHSRTRGIDLLIASTSYNNLTFTFTSGTTS